VNSQLVGSPHESQTSVCGQMELRICGASNQTLITSTRPPCLHATSISSNVIKAGYQRAAGADGNFSAIDIRLLYKARIELGVPFQKLLPVLLVPVRDCLIWLLQCRPARQVNFMNGQHPIDRWMRIMIQGWGLCCSQFLRERPAVQR
jgi:hypothetical protein